MSKSNNLPLYLFHQGTNYNVYDYLGVHPCEGGYVFRVWAPNADRVFLVGDFNAWGDSSPMCRISDGVWELVQKDSGFTNGSLYKFKIQNGNKTVYKSDPYGRYYEKPPATASRYFESLYRWRDDGWMNFRKSRNKHKYSEPLNIYELHIGSWRKHEDGSSYTYCELAAALVPYIKRLGYTHVEFMPVSEHPYEGSWGYQVCGYYAPSARWGTPDDFRYLVDELHRAGVGVIIDWVPAHFPKDEHGLYEFDGQPLYEYQGKDRMENLGWGTRCFDIGRQEVECFLISNAVFWAKEYHVDGLRVDAVASMLYLDYDKKPGEWIPNVYGDNRCLEAIAFFKKLNTHMHEAFPEVMMIAEESTAWENITGFENDGLGFTYKWNMGWMNDTLSYAETDPLFRSGIHGKLTFPIMYAFKEKYILPISHDEVVHGKKSFLDKMPGSYNEKFSETRAFAAYKMFFPGKKLTFMGEEIGQFREWDYKGAIEWFLLNYPSHSGLQKYYTDLNHFYLSHKALYETDDSFDGFKWIQPDLNDISVISFKRIARDGTELLIAINFTPVLRKDFHISAEKGEYEEIFSSDRSEYGGEDNLNKGKLISSNGKITLTLPPLSCVVIEKIFRK